MGVGDGEVAVTGTADAIDLDLYPNEASDLAVVPGGLVAGYDQAFVTVLDEGVIEDSVALLGHNGDDPFGGWEAQRLRLSATVHAGRTEDAEACDFHRDHLYVCGSHFGSKDGPLQARRAWVARVAKADLPAMVAGTRPPVEIARDRFSLHRAINDRLREAGPALRELGPRARERLIGRTIKRAEKKQKAWAGRVREDDQPINIEGMCSSPMARCCSACAIRSPRRVSRFSSNSSTSRRSSPTPTWRRHSVRCGPSSARAARTTRSGYVRCTAPPTTGSTPSWAAWTRWARTAPWSPIILLLVGRTASTGRCGCPSTAVAASSNAASFTPSRASGVSKAWPKCRPGRSCTSSTATTTCTSASCWPRMNDRSVTTDPRPPPTQRSPDAAPFGDIGSADPRPGRHRLRPYARPVRPARPPASTRRG